MRVRRAPRTRGDAPARQPALGSGATTAAAASAARSSASGSGSPRPQAASSTRAASARSRRARGNEPLGGALQVVAQDARQVQEHLRGDARVAVLDAAQEALVER